MDESLQQMTESVLNAMIARTRANIPKLISKLRDNGEQLKLKLKQLEEELERRKNLQLEKEKNESEDEEPIELSNSRSADIRKYRPLPVEFVTVSVEEGDTEEHIESRSSPALSINKMSSGFTKDDVMSRIKAKAEIKKVKPEVGKPPIPRVESSSLKVKKRKMEDVEIVKVVEKEDRKVGSAKEVYNRMFDNFKDKSTGLIDFLMNEINVKEDKVRFFEQKAKFEGNRAIKAEKESQTMAQEIEGLSKLLEEQSGRLSTIDAAHLKELNEAKEKFINDAARTMLETRVDMMQDFKDGKHLAWDIEEARRMLKLYLGEEADGEEVNSPDLDVTLSQVDMEMQDAIEGKNKVEEEKEERKESSNIATAGQEEK